MSENAVSARNRRGDLRRAPRGWTKVTCRKGTLDLGCDIGVRVLDVSETGARLLVGQHIGLNQELSVTLDSPSNARPMRIVGQVAWCVETADHQFCIGIKFGKRIRYQDVLRFT